MKSFSTVSPYHQVRLWSASEDTTNFVSQSMQSSKDDMDEPLENGDVIPRNGDWRVMLDGE